MSTISSSAVSVDVIALRFDPVSRHVVVATHRRGWAPYAGRLALPGVLLGAGERIRDASVRALTKVGATGGDVTGSGQLVTFDEPNRDPRGPTLSIATWATLTRPLPEPAIWHPVRELPALAFDHTRIVADVLPRLAGGLWRDLELTRGLTGVEFTAGDAVDLVRELSGADPDRGNLNRTLAAVPGLRRTDERRSVKGTGRPSVVWSWA